MLLWLLLLLDIALSIVIGVNLNIGVLGSIILGLLIYFVLCAISTVFVGFLSLLLGRINKFALKKKIRYEITNYDTNFITVLNKSNKTEILPMSHIDKIISNSTEVPYLEVNIYNLTGWRAYWLWELYKDKVEYILYLPEKDSVGS